MKIATDRRARENLAKREAISEKIHNKKEVMNLRIRGAKDSKLNEMRATYACCRIQGIIRGFLSRLRTKQLLIYWRAAIVIQRVMRGKLGRIRWMRLYWLTRAVVKSDTALKDLLLRSSLLRRDYKKGMNGWDWQERFDPLTNSIYYYNKHNGRNTWDCPAIFQKHLLCTWDGLTGFKAATSVSILQYGTGPQATNRPPPITPTKGHVQPQQETGENGSVGGGSIRSGGGDSLSHHSGSGSGTSQVSGSLRSQVTDGQGLGGQSLGSQGSKGSVALTQNPSPGGAPSSSAPTSKMHREMTMLVVDKVTGKKKRIKYRIPEEPRDPHQACRCTFKNLAELHQHMRQAHRWYCPACDTCNTGLAFPICGLCGNTLSESGYDGIETMKENVKKVHEKLDQFLKFEKIQHSDENYSLRQRLIDLTIERRKRYEEFMKQNPMEDEDVEWQVDNAIVDQTDLQSQLSNEDGSELLSLHLDDALDPHGMLHRYEEVVRSLYYNRAFLEPYQQSAGGQGGVGGEGEGRMVRFDEGSLSAGAGVRPMPSSSSSSIISYAPMPVHARSMNMPMAPLFPRQNSQVILSKSTPLPVASTQGITALAAISELGYGKQLNASPTLNRKAQRAAAAAASIATHAPPSALTQKKGLKLIRYMYEGTILGRGYQRKPRPPPPPPPPENMEKLPPEMDTSYSGTVWEVPTRTPPLYHNYLPATTQFGVKQHVKWGKLKGQKDEEEDSDNEMDGLPTKELPSSPEVVYDDAVFPYDIDKGRGVYKSVGKAMEAKRFAERGGTKAERHPIVNPLDAGIFFNEELINVVDGALDREAEEERMRIERYKLLHPDEDGDGRPIGPKWNKWGTLNTSWLDSENRYRLLVCPDFMVGACTLTTCPLAHPGIREAAQVTYSKPPGEKKKLPLVRVCPNHDAFQQCCEEGKFCRKYHIYVRPSTTEIIKKMYPLSTGLRLREYKSGAKLEGMYRDENFNGYGIFTWPDKSTYIGDWKEGLRHGHGILRSASGLEYVGGWVAGKRHGLGVATTANGDEYAGEWKEGRMDGVGRLHSCTGDLYEGYFHDSKYHGLGTFFKYGGDTYMGYLENGMASGLGILALNSGEKYKGYFDRNYRHGKGVCSYRNGSRYAGNWYRGYHDGFGVFVSPGGDKYIGEWAGGKKHGKGRYYFSTGDFYDGDFVKNKAKGDGIYFHANGNIYTGQWDNDKRNGRGTYVFLNGSKFTGNFVDNDIHGKGKFDYACGSHYRGEFKRNQKHGRGIFTWPNRAEYKGMFNEDRLEGKGEIRYSSGHYYIGMWKNNKKNGFGSFTYRRGHIYEGNFVDDIRHGKGKMTFSPETTMEEGYDGDWDNDVIHGVGTYRYRVDDGRVVYHGEWDRGIRHGKGLLTYGDGSFYRGSFFLEQMHGHGVYVHKGDGAQYDGSWKNNMRHGIGSSIEPDGTIYHGEYHCNMRQGKGCLEDCDGGLFTGTFESNVKVGKGVFTLPVGVGPVGGPTTIKLRVFAL